MSNTIESVGHLKEEIHRLTEEQGEALKTATYIGMTPDEAREYDDRRSRILALIEQLESLGKAA